MSLPMSDKLYEEFNTITGVLLNMTSVDIKEDLPHFHKLMLEETSRRKRENTCSYLNCSEPRHNSFYCEKHLDTELDKYD